MTGARPVDPIEAKEKRASNRPAPLLIETVPLEGREPRALFGRLLAQTGWKGSAALLEGMPGGWFDGRFSLLAGYPFAIFESKGNVARFTPLEEEGVAVVYRSGEVLAHLQGW